MPETVRRCLVCGKPDPGEDVICAGCRAHVRGEAIRRHREIRKEADRALHKEGTEVLKRQDAESRPAARALPAGPTRRFGPHRGEGKADVRSPLGGAPCAGP